MTVRKLTLFPANPWEPIPDRETFLEKLLQNGFLERNEYSDSGFILGRLFRELLHAEVEEMEFYQIPAWLDWFEQPRLQLGSDMQNLVSVKSPAGKEIGDLDAAYQLIGALREDAQATWEEPRFRHQIPIYELDFEHYLAFGNHFLQIGIYLKPSEAFLNLLCESLGIEYRYANYSE